MLILALLNLLVGIACAYMARERVRVDGTMAFPAFPLVGLHAALVALIALYFYSVHPAWSWMYTVDPANVSALALVPLMAAHIALVGAGWFLGRRLVRTDPSRAPRYVIGGLAIAIVIVAIVGRARLGVSESYAGFLAGQRRGLFEVELGYALIVAVAALGASAAYILIELSVDARRVRSR